MKIFINFKAYPSGLGLAQRELLDFLEQQPLTSPISPTSLHLIVPATEILEIHQNYSLPVWAQHCDPVKTTRATGWVSAEMLKEAGAVGTLLNHSEHRLPPNVLKTTVGLCARHALQTIICCQTVEEGKTYAALRPTYLAFEPPELIASKTASVISNPTSHTSLTSLISLVSPLPLVVGAGIRTRKDIKEASKLGAAGVLLSSVIMEGNQKNIKRLLFEN